MINSKKNYGFFFYFSERQELQQRSDDLRKEVTARITLYKPGTGKVSVYRGDFNLSSRIDLISKG